MSRITFNTVVRHYDSARNGVGQSRSKVVECLPSRFQTKFPNYAMRDRDNFEFLILLISLEFRVAVRKRFLG